MFWPDTSVGGAALYPAHVFLELLRWLSPRCCLRRPLARRRLRSKSAWFRLVTPQAPAAGYMGVRNTTGHAVTLTGARSDACGTLALHRTEGERMRPVSTVTIPPGGTLTLAPGGYHLMCMSPRMAVGGTAQVTLSFREGVASVDAPVIGPRGPSARREVSVMPDLSRRAILVGAAGLSRAATACWRFACRRRHRGGAVAPIRDDGRHDRQAGDGGPISAARWRCCISATRSARMSVR